MSKITVKTFASDKKFNTADDVADLVEEILNNQDNVETLQLNGNSYGIEPLKAIGGALQTCHNLKYLFLNDMFVSRLKNEIPEALRNLFGGIMQSEAKILTINLNDNAIGPVTMPDLVVFLESSNCKSLKKLYLNNCGLGTKGGSQLAQVLPSLENLTELVIGRNRLEIEALTKICNSLATLKHMERLEVPQNGSKGNAIISLCEAVKVNRNLKILNLNDNVLASTSNEIADAVKLLDHLEVLNLGDCLLKTEGAITILSSLNSLYKEKQCSYIKEIILSGNEIKKDAEDVIFSTLETIIETKCHNDKVKVDLSSNNFGEEVADRIRKHFQPFIELIIEEDQGSEEEDENDNDNEENSKENFEISSDLYENEEQLCGLIESKYNDLNSLSERFCKISKQGFDLKEKSFSKNTIAEMDALIKVGKKKFFNNENDFDLINHLLAKCGLIKSETKLSSGKNVDSSGPILAIARVMKEFPHTQKQCIKLLLTDKLKDARYKHLEQSIYSTIYSF